MSDVTERGLKFFAEIMGDERAEQMRQGITSDGFGAAIGKLATDYAFGAVWTRDGLERKQRSLVVIGVLIAQRQLLELKNHIRIGLTNGLTVREIEEALIQTLPYVGFPAVASATTAIVEVLREQGLDTTTRTAEERGML
ncbi:carboxymuconolactone decarboxylase family protein [Novosphingobium taihuense]|uniref:4-carboxymuconolactone decarboxylase n=1 Tax=Novosphingobium taihuense TaxID=260085 RepID=A0A7W7EV32_9SPHN|nr:carboxymuconolactone decarboxylase family protein [Novosphingobium taihuense]MBB4615033.1 4-carboxymuconolactone decarboxylase [Novosphingobium taihuense]TWH84525.1 4-carboxymuconolactone decarboxylase [Novosphingobium taihuense]